MSHYTANLRDIEFCLFDLLKREDVLGKSIYSELDRDTVMGMLEEMKRLSENDLAASFVDGDRIGQELRYPKFFYVLFFEGNCRFRFWRENANA